MPLPVGSAGGARPRGRLPPSGLGHTPSKKDVRAGERAGCGAPQWGGPVPRGDDVVAALAGGLARHRSEWTAVLLCGAVSGASRSLSADTGDGHDVRAAAAAPVAAAVGCQAGTHSHRPPQPAGGGGAPAPRRGGTRQSMVAARAAGGGVATAVRATTTAASARGGATGAAAAAAAAACRRRRRHPCPCHHVRCARAHVARGGGAVVRAGPSVAARPPRPPHAARGRAGGRAAEFGIWARGRGMAAAAAGGGATPPRHRHPDGTRGSGGAGGGERVTFQTHT